MYCFRCGKKLPPRVVNCPECDTPQKRRQRYRTRMILGLVIFLAGAVAGSIFDTLFFHGRAWEHSFLGLLNSSEVTNAQIKADTPPASTSVATGMPPMRAEDMVGMESITSVHPKVAALAASSTPGDVAEPKQFSEAPAEFATDSASVMSSENETAVASSPADSVASEAQTVPTVAAPVVAGRLVFEDVAVLEKGNASSYHGSLSRDGSELIFASNRLKVNGKNTYQCFVKKPLESEKAVQAFAWPGNVWTPEFTPDGKKIVFSSDSVSPEHLFVFDRATGESKALTSGSTKNMMCAVSPDGRLVAFASSAGNNKQNDIWLVGIDGDNLLQLTTSSEDDREPRWSADGKTLYFTRIHAYMKKSDIMQIALDPFGEAQPVVANGRRNWLADVSPDGGTLAYVRSESEDGSKNVLVVREMADGKETVIKPLGNADYFRPVWADDSSGLVFHAALDGSRNLYFARFKRETQEP